MRRSRRKVRGMRFLHPERDSQLELALEDVFIVPSYFDGLSRLDVDLRPDDGLGGSHPVVSANMNAVTGKRMAETMARYGGFGVLPQDMTLETVERIVKHLHEAHTRFDTALTVTPDAPLRDVQSIIRKRAHGIVVVVDEAKRPLGVITQTNLRDHEQYTPARRLMASKPIVLPDTISNRDAFLAMHENRLKAVPIVSAQSGSLVGVMERDVAVRLELLAPNLDKNGRLAVAAAIGISSRAADHAAALAALGVTCIVVDTAHGHQRRMLEAIADVRARLGAAVTIVAGNVCTAEGTKALIEAGADIVKVNVGPGAMCTTRMQTAVGRPSFSSVLHCSAEAHRLGKKVWADGGVRHPRDVVLYLAAGASRVMIGTMLAGTYESPGDIKEDREGRLYKENYGMASARAVMDRTSGSDEFERAKKHFFREGISTSRIYLREDMESAGALLIDVLTGVQSAHTYVGAKSIVEFRKEAVVGVQTASGYREGTPHGQVRY